MIEGPGSKPNRPPALFAPDEVRKKRTEEQKSEWLVAKGKS
jgi:hypothetical protein